MKIDFKKLEKLNKKVEKCNNDMDTALNSVACYFSTFFDFDLICEYLPGDGIAFSVMSDDWHEEGHVSYLELIRIIESGKNTEMEEQDFYNPRHGGV